MGACLKRRPREHQDDADVRATTVRSTVSHGRASQQQGKSARLGGPGYARSTGRPRGSAELC